MEHRNVIQPTNNKEQQLHDTDCYNRTFSQLELKMRQTLKVDL